MSTVSASLVSSKDTLVGVKLKLKRRWAECRTGFLAFWAGLDLPAREAFVRNVYPMIVQSTTDRWSLDERDAKVYHERYNNYLLLSPEFTVDYLCKDSNLPDMYDQCGMDNYLNYEFARKVVTLRQYYRAQRYPFPIQRRADMLSQIPLKPNQHIFRVVATEPGDGDEGSEFGAFMLVRDPAPLLRGRVFEMGGFALRFEFEEVLENMTTVMHCLAALLDEFLTEHQSTPCGDTAGVASALMQCADCGKTEDLSAGRKLRLCAQCSCTYYCSVECQQAHWKSHKAFCARFKTGQLSK